MGLQNLLGILDSDLSFEDKIRLHLTSNVYPPVPKEMLQACVLAVYLCSDGEANTDVSLPDGATYQGRDSAPAGKIVENFHLNLFVNYGDEGDEDG
jgi:hypothetical protein